MSALSRPHDQELSLAMERIRVGDSSGFDEIYNLYIDDVRRCCRRQLGWQDRCEQYEEDLAQEVMLALWQTLYDSDADSGLSGPNRDEWLNAIVHRLISKRCINRIRFLKRQKRYLALSLEDLYLETDSSRFRSLDGDEIDIQDSLQFLLDGLVDAKLRVLIVKKLHGKTNDEIAIEWRISARSVQRQLATVKVQFEWTFFGNP